MKLVRELYKWWKCVSRIFQPNHRTNAKFTSSFIQYWYCQNWDTYRWLEEYRMLKEIGINEIILQNIADTKSHYAVYPTNMNGYTINPIDMVEIALTAAEYINMKVRIGLGFNDDWWSIDAYDKDWLDAEAKVNVTIAREIMSKYQGQQALAGWYIPHEFHPLIALSHDQQENLHQFFYQIARSIKRDSNKTIMIAPFFNARLSGPVTLEIWSNMLDHIFKDTGIDIIALQDSIGAGFNDLDDLDEIYAYTQKAAEKIGLILYAVTETFEETAGKNTPAPQRRIQKQLAKTSPYVSQFVAFSIDHYQNGIESSQLSDYKNYYRYYFHQHK